MGAAAEGDVEGNDGLGTLVHVRGLVELGTEQVLLGGEHLQVAGLAVPIMTAPIKELFCFIFVF